MGGGGLYVMLLERFLPETWEELRRRGLVKLMEGSHGGSHKYIAMTTMAILARCCAGNRKCTITDRSDYYFSLLKHLQYLSGESEAGKAVLDARSQQTLCTLAGHSRCYEELCAGQTRERAPGEPSGGK
jgi:hypothetical protein